MSVLFRSLRVLLLLPLILGASTLQAQRKPANRTTPPSGSAIQMVCCGGGATVTATPSSFTGLMPWASTAVTFRLTNNSTMGDAVTFTLSSGECTLTSYSVWVAYGGSVNVPATCNSGDPNSSGSFTLYASSDDANGSGSASWTTGGLRVQIAAPGGMGTGMVAVHTPRPVIRALFTPQAGESFDTNTTKVLVDGVNITSLARWNRGMLEVELDSANQIIPGGSKTVSVSRCLYTGACTGVQRTFYIPGDSTPVIDLTAMPLERTGGGFETSFGPGVSLSGVNVRAGFETPSYMSLGVSRSLGLVYSTRTSYPRALVAANVTLPWPAGAGDQLKTVLFDGAVRKDSVALSPSTCTTATLSTCRVVLQADYASTPITGGVSRRWLILEVSLVSGGVTKIAAESTEVVLVDRRTSPYGSGWWPTLGTVLVGAGEDRVLVSPDGEASIFRGLGDTLYLPPAGGTTKLARISNGWELRPRGSLARAVFDANGQLLKNLDASGNRDSLAYDGSGRLVTLFDPLNKRISLSYNSATGALDSIVTLVGTTGARATRVVVDSATNQLRYDSLSSAAAHPMLARYGYVTYGSIKGTNQLRYRAGPHGSDSVTVLYDSTAHGSTRPVEAHLLAPFSGGTPPVIRYRPAELQGWRAYTSRDSVFVELVNARGHWTRARLDRWGGSTLVWDQLGTLSRSAFDPLGRVLWTEGKTADSSRVYTTYDALGRLARSYVLRSGASMLRLDSLTYDGNGRVSRRISPQGGVTTFQYDQYDRLIVETAPGGSATTRTYRSDGQLASVTYPTKTSPDSIQYDTTFQNPIRWYGDSGQLKRSAVLDAMGRVRQVDTRIRVAQQAVLQWQVRRSTLYLDAAGLVDSVEARQSSTCNDPCTTPSGFAILSTTKTTFDSIGRTVRIQVVGNNAATETFNLDALGRAVGIGAAGGGRDSLEYDLVGNVTKRITRRGDVMTTYFDSRNRPDSTVVPGYGTIRMTYGGPQDQLTRRYVTGYIDSLGGVNPNRAYVYDQRGRLIQDSLWTGGVGRAAVHTYDSLDRPSTMVDALGTWTTQYTATTGLIARYIASTGDTLSFAYDSIGRVKTMDVLRGTSFEPPADTVTYSPHGELMKLAQGDVYRSGNHYTSGTWSQVGANAGNNDGLVLQSRFDRTKMGPLNLPTTEYLTDSMTYDAFRRLTSWKERFGVLGSNLVSETYAYDNNGNLTIGGTTTVFASGSNRLTSIVRTGGAKSVYTYDVAGNLIERTDSLSGAFRCTWQYGYNALGQMVSVRAKATAAGALQLVARYAYDVNGNRIARRVYTNTANCTVATVGYTRYAVRGAQVTFETDSLGANILRRYIWGPGTDNLVAVQVGSSTDSIFYAITDQIGSIRAWMPKNDETVRWWGRYRPYGAVIDSGGTTVNTPYRWTTREYDPETGYYFNRARYYDPSVGRFTQEDPIGRTGGANLYGYAGGSPLAARDASGLAKDYATYMPAPQQSFWSEIRGFQSWADEANAWLDYQAERYFDYVEYQKNFAENKAANSSSDTPVEYNVGDKKYSTTLGEVWSNATELTYGQFSSLYGMSARDPLVSAKLAATLSGGNVGTGDFLPDMLSRALGGANVFGARAGDFVMLRASNWDRGTNNRFARLAYTHEAVHLAYPQDSNDEKWTCWKTEQQGNGRYNEFGGLRCY